MSKITLIGAGSAQFGCGTLGEIFQSEVLRGSELVLHDINPASLQSTAEKAQRFLDEHKLPFTLRATTDRPEAVRAADFIVISIEVGNRFVLWDQDRTVPQQYGIRQVFGENGGPGGLFHSLRITPPILEICADILRLAPEAYVFNYSNPMSRICTAVHRKFPDLRFIGLCHEPLSLERYLPKILDVPYEELELRAAGLNHFSCLLSARYRNGGQDAYPDIRAKAPAFFASLPGSTDHLEYYLETGVARSKEGHRELPESVLRSARDWTERSLFQFILLNLDLLPTTSDSHFGEYLPWAWDVVDHRGILDFYRYYSSYLVTVPAKIELMVKERLVPIMEGILTNSGHEEPGVNVLNQGFMTELPQFLSVEVPARIDKNGVHGISLSPLPPAYAGILQNQIAVHAMTAEAILTGSKKAVVQALLVDPIVDRARCLPELVDVMLSLQRDYLSYLH